jgi:osmoprotectant transport system permease protein
LFYKIPSRILPAVDLIEFILANRAEVAQFALEHLFLVAVGTGAAALVGIPAGVALTRSPWLSRPVLAGANVLQTIPSLALFGFLIPLLGAYGIGRVPAIIALFLYSLLPIIRNTYTGIESVDPAVREAARGMGMTDWQLLTLVELPLARSVIVAGVRVAAVIAVGTATIAAAVGAGGLGTYIFRGLRTTNDTLILAGAVPAALMALGADFALGWFERSLAPEATRTRVRAARLVAATAALSLAVLVVASVAWGQRGAAGPSRPVVVVSKDFTESVLLSELVAQSLEREGVPVVRKFELSGDLCHRALVEGQADVYVEYTGTAYTSILKYPPATDPRAVFERVRADYAERFGLEWLEPLGFENTFAILVRGDDARRLGLKTVSDAAPHTPRWRAGFGQDFVSREDGYPGFARTYGLRFAEPPREMDLALTYRALAGGQVDLIAGNSTDGLIDALGLVQLEDDRRYFPPYEAAAVARRDALERYPEIRAALARFAGRITAADMRRLNYAVDADKRDPRDVVQEFRGALP